MASDYGRRQRAFEDIFARPLAAPNGDRRASYAPQPGPPSQAQAGPSAHVHGPQMTPAFDPYAASQPPPRDDRRMSMMSSASSHHGYFQPQQPMYAPSAPQAGPSRSSAGYGPPLAAPQHPPWPQQQSSYYGQGPPPMQQQQRDSFYYQQTPTQTRADLADAPSPPRSSPRAARTSPYSQRPPSTGSNNATSPQGSASGLPPVRGSSFDLTHDPQLNAYFDQRVYHDAVEEAGEGERTLSPPPVKRPYSGSGEDENLSPSTERSDQPTSGEWDSFSGQQYGAYLDDSARYAASSMARRSSNDSGNSFFGDRSDHTGVSSSQAAATQHLRSSFASTQSYRHPEGPRPPPGYPRSSASLHSAPSYRSSPAPGPMTPMGGFDPYAAQQYQNGMAPDLQQRRSIESVRSARVMPTQPRPASGYTDRAMTMSGLDRPDLRPPGPPPSALITTQRRAPIVYPALLSKVAEAFKVRVMLSERVKDGLAYTDAFDGRDAVDKLAYIIKTTDRNLALLLGRALDAQKFFHDVTYEHRLRDSPYEVYQFRERDPFVSADDANDFYGGGGAIRPPSPGQANAQRPPSVTDTMLSDEGTMPSGVFTLLTDCYSPTCTRDRLCYSIACPRRLEQQARLKLKPQPGLKRSTSMSDTSDDVLITREPGALWSESVPKDVLESTSDREKKRQEAINEAIYTERDFVHDLEYLRDHWVKGLRQSNVIPESRREDFITQVFWNVLDVHSVNIKLCDQLNRRQKSAHVVERIGDIYLEHVPHFQPFVQYGAHQLYGKYEFEKERSNNPAFAKFVDDLERAPESRKLELNGYLTKPTTRLARYPLLLEAVLKHTEDDNPDKIALPKVIKLVRDFLARVNEESGRSENRFTLAQLDQQLVFRPGEAVDLKLREENREMIFKGGLKKRGGTQSESAELQVFLFDHAVLMVKQKTAKTQEQYKVYRKPIPLELLVVTTSDDAGGTQRLSSSRPKSLMARGSSTAKAALINGAATASQQAPPPGPANKNGYAMTLTHLGRKGYSITLWSPSWAGRKKWLEKIEQRQAELRERSLVFDSVTLSDGVFVGNNKVTCAAPFDGGERMVFGTDSGVYLADLRLLNEKPRMPIKVIATPSVTQVDVLEEHGILIVLADKIVQTFFIDHLDSSDPIGTAKRARKIHTNASFFKTGQCLGRTLVCIVKSGAVSSTIKTMEPIEQHGRSGGKKQPGLRKFLQGNPDSLRVFKEFYLPLSTDSVHFLKSKLCVGCVKGFEIVDLETLDTQGLLDPADSSLDFVQKRENVKPLAIFRVDGDFLLCYDDFAFYVNKNGWRARSNWLVQWEGHPTSFALRMPYVLAFEPTFVEVRHVETGALMQILQGSQLRCLFSDTPPSSYSMPPPYLYQQQQQQLGPPSQQQQMYGQPPMPQQQYGARPPANSRHSSYGGPQQQMMGQPGPYGSPVPGGRPPPQMMVSRPIGGPMASRSMIVMGCDGGTGVVRLQQTMP